MQKKLIALAIAGLASTAAFAQSNVQIYGSIDMGVSHRGDSRTGASSQTAIDSGISDGNRLGFKGSEDLGNGLKAVFTLETGFLSDTGNYDGFTGDADGTAANLFTRLAYVGLSSDSLGTVIAGRLLTPQYSFLTSIDPFGEGTVGTYLNVAGNDVLGVTVVPRVSNAVAYVSPSFSGFNVTAAFSNEAFGQEEISGAGKDANNRVYAVLPRYTNGPIDIGLNYHVIDVSTGNSFATGANDVRNWALGGTYDFGVAKLHGFYSATKADLVAAPDLKVKNWMLGVSAPFGKHTVMASYNTSEAQQSGVRSADSSQWAVGYTYSLSKRTNLYAAYADISNDNEDGTTVGKFQRVSSTNDASNAGNTYQNGFNVGIRHTF